MNALLISAAAVAIVSVDPAPLSNGAVIFRKNEMVVTFNQLVVTHEIEVIDADGCKVSQSSTVDGGKVVIQLKACKIVGYPPGHMHIGWTVNGEKGEHHLHVAKHH